MFKSSAFIMSLLLVLAFCGSAWGKGEIIHDAEYQKLLNQYGDAWQAEDKELEKRLAELEAKHGKKPNIIYILTDDVGWGELGWQGGGKHRGTPSPELDKMAYEGMRFWAAYSEPSCTPSRSRPSRAGCCWRSTSASVSPARPPPTMAISNAAAAMMMMSVQEICRCQ